VEAKLQAIAGFVVISILRWSDCGSVPVPGILQKIMCRFQIQVSFVIKWRQVLTELR